MSENEKIVNRPHPDRFYRAIKAGTQIVVDELFGIENCASLTRGSISSFSNFTNINETSFIGADQIADLEHHIGDCPITTELARIQGKALVDLPSPNNDKNWMMEFANLARQSGKALDKLAHAMNDDGKVDAQEIIDLNLRKRTQTLIQSLVNLEAKFDETEKQAEREKRRNN